MWIKEIFQGFCMALADSVPGVSGGSIAFLMGFYDEFITSLNNLISRAKEKRNAAFAFIGKLGIGWVVGMGLSVTLLAVVFDKYIYQVSSLFLGFILVAIFMMVRENGVKLIKRKSGIVFMIGGAVLVAGITLLNQHAMKGVDLAQLTVGSGIYIFIAAMIAISAMVLPGISGSTLLLVFGLYMPVISALKSLMHFDFAYLPALIIFGLGVLTGIIAFVRWIKLALEKFPTQTMYAIIGLMIGSLYAIVMGPATLKIPKPAMSVSTFSPVFFIIGAVLVLALEGYKRHVSSYVVQSSPQKTRTKTRTE